MINKQNLWFVTLFSLILILGIYYLSLKDEEITVFKSNNDNDASITINETDPLIALRVAEDESVLSQIEEYQNTLLDASKSVAEKNDAYENIQVINKQKVKASEIENLIKEKFNLQNFIKFDKDQINVTISKKEHSAELANNIIRAIQALYEDQMYITVKFQ